MRRQPETKRCCRIALANHHRACLGFLRNCFRLVRTSPRSVGLLEKKGGQHKEGNLLSTLSRYLLACIQSNWCYGKRENDMMNILRKFRKDEKGATAIEYGLIAALVSIAAIVAMGQVGTQLNSTFTNVATGLGAK